MSHVSLAGGRATNVWGGKARNASGERGAFEHRAEHSLSVLRRRDRVRGEDERADGWVDCGISQGGVRDDGHEMGAF